MRDSGIRKQKTSGEKKSFVHSDFRLAPGSSHYLVSFQCQGCFHFDHCWHTLIFFKKNNFLLSHIHIFQVLDFQLRYSESCCFQACCQTLTSFTTRESLIPLFRKEREREISVGCSVE